MKTYELEMNESELKEILEYYDREDAAYEILDEDQYTIRVKAEDSVFWCVERDNYTLWSVGDILDD